MDSDGYRQVVTSAKDRVFGYAARMLGDREDARDVAQEALVRLWEHRDDVAAEPPEFAVARAWLLRTAHNLCLDRLRVRTARPQAGEDALGLLPDGRATSPERAALASETGGRIGAVLAALEPRDRALLLLREVHGLSYDEMARVMGAPLGTVKAALHRARERARGLLAGAGVRP